MLELVAEVFRLLFRLLNILFWSLGFLVVSGAVWVLADPSLQVGGRMGYDINKSSKGVIKITPPE